MQPWQYTIGYLVPLSVVVGYSIGGLGTFLTPMLVFVAVPLLDFIIGVDDYNPSPKALDDLESTLGFRLVLYLFLPVQFGLLFWGAAVFSGGALSVVEKAGFVLSMGITTGGLGITIAHELAHKKRKLDVFCGQALLMSVCYMHFHIEHNLGHHTRVATADDPATARLGESFYAFYPRTLLGSFSSAWKTEVARLRHGRKRAISPENRMLRYILLPALLATLLGNIWGGQAVIFFVLQSIVAFSLLEVVNYVEHYGLQRRRLPSGKYEKVTAVHSWNANQRLTNCLLFKLQRHSDHHVHPVKAYQTLRHYSESPQLPTGYAGMMLLALVPPLWKRVMHPILENHQNENTTLSPNIT